MAAHFTRGTGPSKQRRRLLVFLSCLQSFTAGGLLGGWPAIAAHISLYGGLDQRFVHMVYVWASTANLFANLGAGLLLDKKGPRVCSSISLAAVMIGCILVGVSGFSWRKGFFSLGMVFIGLGGPGILFLVELCSKTLPNANNNALSLCRRADVVLSLQQFIHPQQVSDHLHDQRLFYFQLGNFRHARFSVVSSRKPLGMGKHLFRIGVLLVGGCDRRKPGLQRMFVPRQAVRV
jgi:MFS family permease